MKLFLSYRRIDSGDVTRQLYDGMVAEFGRENIFYDQESIPVGVHWREFIGSKIIESDVFIPVIGDTWVDELHRRLGSDDLVWFEVEESLNRLIPAVPIRIGEGEWPEAAALPSELAPLLTWQGHRLRLGDSFGKEFASLVLRLKTLEKECSAKNRGAFQTVLEKALSFDRDTMLKEHWEFVRKYPGSTKQELSELLIRRNAWKAAGSGFVTGLPSNLLIAVPAALLDMTVVIRTQAYLAGRIALLFDEDYFNSNDIAYELMIPIMGMRVASEFVGQMTKRGASGLTRQAIKTVLTKGTLSQFRRVMLKYFGLKVGQRTVTKTVPIVGGVIGGIWNYTELRVVGQRAFKYFSDAPIGPDS